MAFTDIQTKALSAKLSTKHVRTREKGGRKISYVEGWRAIAEANRIFGYDAWDRETLSIKCLWRGERRGLHECSYAAKVRVLVRAGPVVIRRDGTGCGHGSSWSAGEAHELAVKEAETDALKRALVTFGNPFGLALYDPTRARVRGGRAKSDTVGDQWKLLNSNAEVLQVFEKADDYVLSVAANIEAAEDPEALHAFWANNLDTLTEIRSQYPELEGNSRSHPCERLGSLYRQKTRRLGRPHQDQQRNGHIVDKSVLALGEPKRVRDRAHLENVARQPCAICGRKPSQAHHLRFVQRRALGRKVSDEWVVPLCSIHHRQLHKTGDEKNWWADHGIAPIPLAESLWERSRSIRGT